MANRPTLKSYFNTGDRPTEANFATLIDSLRHLLDDPITWVEIEGKPSSFPSSWSDVSGKPSSFTPSSHNHAASEINSGTFASARLGAGTATDGYALQIISGVPTWAAISGGGGGGGISGLTTNRIPKATSGTTIGNSQLFDDGTQVGVGTTSPVAGYLLDINGDLAISSVIGTRAGANMVLKASGIQLALLNPSTGGIALGNSAVVGTGSYAIAIGQQSEATNTGSVAIGYLAKTTGSAAVSLGFSAQTTANNVLNLGMLATSNHDGGCLMNQGTGAAATTDTTNQFKAVYGNGFRFNTANASTAMFIDSSNRVAVGTTSPVSNAALDVASTSRAFYPPRMSTTQRDAMSGVAAGAMIFNTTTGKHEGYDGTSWNGFY